MRSPITSQPPDRIRQIAHQITRGMANSSPAAAPWRSAFLSHVQTMQQPSLTLSTLRPVESSSSSAAQFAPRARTVILRGMWASLPANPKNTAERNPDMYESDLLSITTDARMEKIPELFSTASQTELQSGRGGPVEAVFWAVEPQTQWRLRGHAYIVGPDIDSPAAAPVRAALDGYMRGTGSTGSWSWSRELTAHFGNLSPFMRGTFRNPPPGRPLTDRPEEGYGLGQQVEDLNDPIARKNFRVLVIVPEEVDRVDLSNPDNARRWNYTFVGTEGVGSWNVTEVWP